MWTKQTVPIRKVLKAFFLSQNLVKTLQCDIFERQKIYIAFLTSCLESMTTGLHM